MRASAVVMSDARVRAWIRGGVVGLAAIATGLVALAPACTTHQCDSSSYDYYGGRMLDPNTYETNDWNEPWISYPGNVTVTVHFPPGIGRQPLEVVGNVGTSATPNGGAQFMGGDNLAPVAGQLAEEFFVTPTGFSVFNASCAPYFARFVVTFPPVTFTLFGGMGAGANRGLQALGDTWTWDGTQWTEVELASQARAVVGPTARSGITMARAGGTPFFFGGFEGNDFYDNDFWQWDGVSWSPRHWPCTAPDAGSGCIPPIPVPRAYATFAALPHRASAPSAPDKILMFGGKTNTFLTTPPTGELNDTWIWDGNSWTQLDPNAPGPSARWGASAASLDGKVVLFGGQSMGAALGDTWVWDDSPTAGRAGTWMRVDVPNGPVARSLASAASFGNEVVLSGGNDGFQDLGDTWTWDGHTWTQVVGPGPGPRSQAALAAFGQSLLLFGGFRRGVALGDFWSWSGSEWQEVPDLSNSFPPARGAAGATGL